MHRYLLVLFLFFLAPAVTSAAPDDPILPVDHTYSAPASTWSEIHTFGDSTCWIYHVAAYPRLDTLVVFDRRGRVTRLMVNDYFDYASGTDFPGRQVFVVSYPDEVVTEYSPRTKMNYSWPSGLNHVVLTVGKSRNTRLEVRKPNGLIKDVTPRQSRAGHSDPNPR